jgi:hypothetical protein
LGQHGRRANAEEANREPESQPESFIACILWCMGDGIKCEREQSYDLSWTTLAIAFICRIHARIWRRSAIASFV